MKTNKNPAYKNFLLYRKPIKAVRLDKENGDSYEQPLPEKQLANIVTQVTTVNYVPKMISKDLPVSDLGPSDNFVLPPQEGKNIGKKTLILDLDETLVHSSFQPVSNADIIIPVCYFQIIGGS